MPMCVQCCHILRFFKNNSPSRIPDQYVVLMQKGIKIGPVVLHIFLGIYGVKPEICICVQRFHIFLRFLKKNTPSHVRGQYVVRMQKGIKIGPVVWPLTRSYTHIYLSIFLSSRIALYKVVRYYDKLNKEIKIKCTEAKEAWLDKNCQEIENSYHRNDNQMYKRHQRND